MSERDVDQIPPNNLDAEKALLGAILVDRAILDRIGDVVGASDFYASFHEAIFKAMLSLAKDGDPVDAISVAEKLKQRGMLDKIGGSSYILGLIDTVQSAKSADYYGRIISEKAALRALIHVGAQIQQIGYEAEEDVEEAVRRAEELVRLVAGRSGRQVRLETVSDIAQRIANSSEEAIRTPWPTLDRATGGFFPGEQIYLPGAPKSGKSGVLAQLGAFIVCFFGIAVIFALEMEPEATTRRMLALHSGVSAKRQRTGHLKPQEQDAIETAKAWYYNLSYPYYIFGRECDTLAKMHRALRWVQRQHPDMPIRMVGVDHVGFVRDGFSTKSTSRNDALNMVNLELLNIGKEYEAVNVVVAHLNRKGMEGRPSIATLGHIRDGGNPEGSAHAIVVPYRPHPSDPHRWHEGEFCVVVQRDGVPGACPVHYQGRRNMWLDVKAEQDRPWFEMPAPIEQSALDFTAETDNDADEIEPPEDIEVPFP